MDGAAGGRTVKTPGTRAQSRDSMMMSATIRRGTADAVPMRVRNLSAGGMMGEAEIVLEAGETVELTLRTVGAVQGVVAWADDERIGIAFKTPIDRLRVRRTVPLKTRQDQVGPQSRRPGLRTA